MPYDLKDKMIDFQLILESFIYSIENGAINNMKVKRLLNYWFSLSSDIFDKIDITVKL